ncbi:hypothetical protein [Bacillus sp. 03113]|uniref:hypothetical protein n=1 Tax=Bacillus sp. 03113 TaxID=2578211 RepID=UPI0011433EFD|nr:hypothetical protein [Bacillus sp. 03113]
MTNQERLDAILEKIATDYGKLNAKQQAFAVKEIGRIRAEIADLLADYAGDDGTIKKQRLTRLLRNLDSIEAGIRKTGMTTMETVINESSAFTTNAITGALTEVIGAAAISGIVTDRINEDVVRYVINRFGDDGLVLSDRVWNVAGDIRDEMAKTLRSGIIRGESVGTLIKRVRDVHDNETWKIKRLVVTEGNTAHRVADAYCAQRSPVVQAVRIHRGKADRPEHRCSQLEQEDRYGMGSGVYLPSDSEVFNPHVNCTSFLTYVLTEKAK